MSLPFELNKKHKGTTKAKWKYKGLIMDNFEEIYQEYIYQTNCELCGKLFEKSHDRQMEHCHITGEFRNIVCQKCNSWKADFKRKNDVSPYIRKVNNKNCNLGFIYKFKVTRNRKRVIQKASIDLNELEEFRDNWIVDNPQWFT